MKITPNTDINALRIAAIDAVQKGRNLPQYNEKWASQWQIGIAKRKLTHRHAYNTLAEKGEYILVSTKDEDPGLYAVFNMETGHVFLFRDTHVKLI